jgi:predicted acyl esterase
MLIVLLTLMAFMALAQDTPAPQTEMAPMRDGVRLATDFYLPRGPMPTIRRIPLPRSAVRTWARTTARRISES